MNSPKTITQLIDSPRLIGSDSTDQVEHDSIDLKSITKQNFIITDGTYRYIDMTDVEISEGTGTNVICFRASLIRCRLQKMLLTGLQLPEANFKDVVFSNCKINLANFRSATFERCIFKDCDLTEADFAMAKCTMTLFDSCQLIKTDFSNAVNKRLEFISSPLHSINGLNGLKGSTIDQQNLIEIAPILASELGIIIKDI